MVKNVLQSLWTYEILQKVYSDNICDLFFWIIVSTWGCDIFGSPSKFLKNCPLGLYHIDHPTNGWRKNVFLVFKEEIEISFDHTTIMSWLYMSHHHFVSCFFLCQLAPKVMLHLALVNSRLCILPSWVR